MTSLYKASTYASVSGNVEEAPASTQTPKDFARNVYSKRAESVAKETKKHLKRLRRDNRPRKYGPQNDDAVNTEGVLTLLQTACATSDLTTLGFIDQMENVVLLMVLLSEVKTVRAAVAAIVQYVKLVTKRSIIADISAFIADICGSSARTNEYEEQSDEPSWLLCCRSIFTNWQHAIRMPAFKHVAKIISMSVSLGLCNLSSLPASLDLVKAFIIAHERKDTTPYDFVDALFSAAGYFVEAGYEAFRTGSIRPFIFENQNMSRLDDLYFKVKGAMSVLSAGNLADSDVKDENTLIMLIEQGITAYADVIPLCKREDHYQKVVLERRYADFRAWKLEFIAKSSGGGLREAPFGLFIKGPPGIGKSVMTSTFMTSLLVHNGFDADPDRIVTLNLGDAYMSSYRTCVNGVVADDIGQGIPKYENSNPARVLIDIINNTVSYATKADLADKGVVKIQPKVFIGNTNLEFMGFKEYLACPAAGMRRGYHLEVSLKPEYSSDGRYDTVKVEAGFASGALTNRVCPDIYFFSLYSYSVGNSLGQLNKNVVSLCLDALTTTTLENVSYAIVMEAILSLSRTHFASQKALVDQLKTHAKAIKLCKCGKLNYMCGCAPFEPQMFESWRRNFIFLPRTRAVGAHQAVLTLWQELQLLTALGRFSWCHFAPAWLIYHPIVKAFLFLQTYSGSHDLEYGCLVAFAAIWTSLQCCWLVIPWLFIIGKMIHAAEEVRIRKLQGERTCLSALTTVISSVAAKRSAQLAVVFAAILVARTLYRTLCASRVEEQSDLEPKTFADIRERDNEASWSKVVMERPRPSKHSATIPPHHLSELLKYNLLYATRINPLGTKSSCNMFMVSSTYGILPSHMVTSDVREFQFVRYSLAPSGRTIVGSTSSAMICSADVYPVGNADLVVIYLPNIGLYKDLSPYLQIDEHNNVNASISYLTKDLQFEQNVGFTVAKKAVVCSGKTFSAYTYTLRNMNTFKGLCSGVIMSQNSGPAILGFHVGGHENSAEGCGVPFTARMYTSAIAHFKNKVGALGGAVPGELPLTFFGNSYLEGEVAHVKSPLSNIPEGVPTSGKFLGTVSGRVKAYSAVEKSMIADDVTTICDSSTEWGPPQFGRSQEIWNDAMLAMLKPAIGPNFHALNKAATDYFNQIKPIFTMADLPIIKPLTRIEIVSGQDGVRFVDGMNLNTSMGFPLSGPKRNVVIYPTEQELEETPGAANPLTFPEFYWLEMERHEETWASGVCVHAIFKGCLKDEAKVKGKLKIRVFQAAPLVLQIAIRKYFLPVARLISAHPLLTECAVGVNAYGKEWEQMDAHVSRYGREAVMDGDFKEYDKRMAAIVTGGAFDILIRCAELLNYTARDLVIMRGIANDVVYPITAMNGDLVQFFGSTPSGHNMTVYINSICNSLLLRCGFYAIYPSYTGRVCDAVAAITYGDDFDTTIHEKWRGFNFVTYKAYLASIGYTLTHPSKSDALDQPFLPENERQFLKRKSNYVSDIDCVVGALDNESIFKSLKTTSKTLEMTAEQLCAVNMSGALREWFMHGRDVYQRRYAEMVTIATKHDILSLCDFFTYDEFVEKWYEKGLKMSHIKE